MWSENWQMVGTEKIRHRQWQLVRHMEKPITSFRERSSLGILSECRRQRSMSFPGKQDADILAFHCQSTPPTVPFSLDWFFVSKAWVR